MDAIMISVTLTLTAITALYWGEVLSIRLPETDKRFDRKPFNCRPCFTFHISWLLSSLSGVVSGYACLIFIGIVVSFALFFVTKYIDNKKITK